MATYIAENYPPGYDFSTSTLFWGALIFVGLFTCCLFAWKAIEWLRNRRSLEDQGDIEIPEDPAETWASQAVSRPPGEHYEDALGPFGGMSQREQEEFFSTYGPRKVRKAMRARRRSRANRADDNK